jgi:hypothetical protein
VASATSQLKLPVANCASVAVRQSHKRLISRITCHEVGMMELANGIGLKPRYFVTEVSIEHVESWLRQRPSVADVHLQREIVTEL